jgi:glycosyltransferase involved in cell wall biosynthesis
LQRAIILLNRGKSRKIKLHLVGGGGKDEQSVLDIVKKNPDEFVFHGEIRDKAALQAIFKKCDIFSMPSRHETFGLVYIEAMLQGLPVLYTEGEGIDGFYSERIGEKISEHSIDEIKAKLKIIIDNFEQYLIPLKKIKRTHDWKIIARDYREIYNNCI